MQIRKVRFETRMGVSEESLPAAKFYRLQTRKPTWRAITLTTETAFMTSALRAEVDVAAAS